jgi:hypothetical protein
MMHTSKVADKFEKGRRSRKRKRIRRSRRDL